MPDTIYITGGSGFVGQALTRHFLEQGDFVYVQSRSPEKQQKKIASEFISSPRFIDRKIDLLINLAGKPLATRWSKNTKQEIYASRVDFTRKLFDDFSRLPAEWLPKRLFSTSAIGYYRGGEAIQTESSANGRGFSATLCRDWEQAARLFKNLGCSVHIMRLGVVLDTSGGSLKAMLPSFKLGLGARLGSGNQWFSWIGLGDLLAIYQYCINLDILPEVINAVAPSAIRNTDFTRQLASALKRPAILSAPEFLLKALLGEGADDFLLANLRVSPVALQTMGFEFETPDIESLFSQILSRNTFAD